jgi:hypothetical protein
MLSVIDKPFIPSVTNMPFMMSVVVPLLLRYFVIFQDKNSKMQVSCHFASSVKKT